MICTTSVVPDFSLKTLEIPLKYGNLLKEAKILLILLFQLVQPKNRCRVTGV